MQILEDLEDWTVPIRSFRRSLETSETSPGKGKATIAQQLRAIGVIVAPDAGADSLLFQQQILAMSRVLRYTDIAHVNTVMANLELIGFGAIWFGKELWGAAENLSALEALMKRFVHDLVSLDGHSHILAMA
jgi:hypothetical protein